MGGRSDADDRGYAGRGGRDRAGRDDTIRHDLHVRFVPLVLPPAPSVLPVSPVLPAVSL